MSAGHLHRLTCRTYSRSSSLSMAAPDTDCVRSRTAPSTVPRALSAACAFLMPTPRIDSKWSHPGNIGWWDGGWWDGGWWDAGGPHPVWCVESTTARPCHARPSPTRSYQAPPLPARPSHATCEDAHLGEHPTAPSLPLALAFSIEKMRAVEAVRKGRVGQGRVAWCGIA